MIGGIRVARPRGIELLMVLLIIGALLAASYITLVVIQKSKGSASNGNENAPNIIPRKEERKPCDATWAPGVCLKVLTPGYSFDPIKRVCTFSEGSGCSDPPYPTLEDCETACGRVRL